MGKCSVDPEISKRKDQLFASMQARKKTDIQESESDTDYTYLIGQEIPDHLQPRHKDRTFKPSKLKATDFIALGSL